MKKTILCRAVPVVTICLCFSSLFFAVEALAASSQAPYAGQQSRAIKSLSQKDVDDLLAGRGWGLAKPAELNGYPGPAHVLEAADELNLPQETRERIEEVFAAMQAEAQRLGKLYVEAEQRLEEAFAGKSVSSPTDLEGLLKDAERLRAKLRMVHLSAHLETAPLLTRHQTMLYNKLRGYGTETGHHQHGNH